MSKQQVFKAVSRVPAYQMVEESIRGMILGGELAPGDKLPPETELAVQLKVTRPTVREAFRSLEGAGLIKRGPRRRMVVTPPSPHIVHNAMNEAIILHGVTYREMWEVTMALEPAIAGLAATRISPELLNEIEANLERTAQCLDNLDQFRDNPDELAKYDMEFHELVTKAAGNHAMLLAKAPFGGLTPPVIESVIRSIGPGQRLLEAHTNIFKALKSGGEEEAREWMSRHVHDYRRGLELAGVELDSPINTHLKN